MTRDNENKNRLLSALLTLLLGGAIVTTLVVSNLHYEYPPKDEKAKMMQNEPIEFGGDEYVDIQDLLAQNNDGGTEADEPAPQEEESATTEETNDDSSEPESGQNELENQGTVNEPPQPSVSSNQESPAKEQVQPKKDTKPQAESTTTATDTKRKGEKESTKTKNTDTKTESQIEAEQRVQFNNGNGSQNTSGGNANGTVGKPSVGGGLVGYTLESFPDNVPCPGPGTVEVQVTVNSDGKIYKAKVTGGTLKNRVTEKKWDKACKICRGLALRSKFSVPKNLPPGVDIGTGTLTYTVE